jgi:prepilin-type N-terminal cleavage/methylation domain-containing protein
MKSTQGTLQSLFDRHLLRVKLECGFTLIELLIVLLIVGLLSSIAWPSYRQHVARGARLAVQGELLQLATLQEKIYLNSVVSQRSSEENELI